MGVASSSSISPLPTMRRRQGSNTSNDLDSSESSPSQRAPRPALEDIPRPYELLRTESVFRSPVHVRAIPNRPRKRSRRFTATVVIFDDDDKEDTRRSISAVSS